eukprot:PhF_6_TR17046/c1_g4_i4/m.25972
MDTVRIVNSSSEGEGGLIAATNQTTIILRNVKATNVTSKLSGGVLYGVNYAQLEIEDSEFTNSSSMYGEGGFCSLRNYSSVHIRNSLRIDTSSSASNGGVFAARDSSVVNVTVFSLHVVNAYSSEYGGLVAMYDGDATVSITCGSPTTSSSSSLCAVSAADRRAG